MAQGLVPEGAWETHIHVFDPDNFPYAVPRPYTPAPAFINQYPTSTTGCKNIVVVHASMQGNSPAPLVATLNKQKDLPGYSLRGLMSLDPTSTPDEEIDRLHEAGVRGARLHRMAWGHGRQAGSHELIEQIKSISSKTARKGWVIGIFTDVRTWAGMADFIRNKLDPRVRMLADHFGGTFPGEEDLPEFATFLDLIREKKVWVKVSGFERLYNGAEKGMAAIEPIVKSVAEAGPDQIVYGSDWPHTQLGVSRKGKTDKQRLEEVEGFREVDDLGHIKTLREWIRDDETWHKLFVTNPENLFK